MGTRQETFTQAHDRIFQELGALGWKLSLPTLKTRHATSPDGLARVWFKPQALYYSGGRETFASARSLHVDARGYETAKVAKSALSFVGVDRQVEDFLDHEST